MSCDGTLNYWKHPIKDTGHLISTIDKTDQTHVPGVFEFLKQKK